MVGLSEAASIWANDLMWAWVNTRLARRRAIIEHRDEIHAMCTEVVIPVGDSRRRESPIVVLERMGCYEIAEDFRKKFPSYKGVSDGNTSNS